MCMARMSQIPPELAAEMTPAVRAFVETLFARIDELEDRVEQLQSRLGMTPSNSSLPPASQHPHAKPSATKPKSKRKRGGQPGHQKCERPLIPVDQCADVIPLKPTQCRRCGQRLRGDDPQPLRHQVWELPEIQPLVTEYQRHRLTCPCCHTSTCAALPAGVPEHQSGPRLVAFTALLMACFRQSKRRTALFLETILNIPCSAGLTVKHQNLATQALAGCYDELADALPQVDAANLDETATKEAGGKAWVWVAVTSLFTVFRVRTTRAASVAHDMLGATFDGVVGCDRYAGYEAFRRQLCWAHLKRDWQAMIDAGGTSKPIGNRLMDVTHELFRHWHRYRDGTITHATMKRKIESLQYPLWSALEDGMRCGHAKTAGTCRHVFDRFDHLWTFLDHAEVEPTNNAAERALRHAVIWRKLSFGTQSVSGSRFVETLLTVIETCRRQQRDIFNFLTNALHSHLNGHPSPSLLTGV